MENTFEQEVYKGTMDKYGNMQLVPARIDDSQVAALTPGQAVTLVDDGGKELNVVAAAVTDPIFGFIAYTTRNNSHLAGDRTEIAMCGSGGWLQLEAGAAVVKGAAVEFAVTGSKVISSAGTNTIVGTAMDKAAADGDLIRVALNVPRTNQV